MQITLKTEFVAHESKGHGQPVRRYAVACPFHDVRIHILPPRLLQGFGSLRQRLRWHDIVLIPVNKEHRRARDNFIHQCLWVQPPEVGLSMVS